MTMSPDDFRERYAAALTDEPPRPPVEGDIAVAQGRHVLHRRRIAAGAAACLAVVAIVGGSTVLRGLGVDRDAGDRPTPAVTPNSSISEGQLLDECRNGHATDPARAKRLFRSGRPIVKVSAFTQLDGSAALESADGRHWAWCLITPGEPGLTRMFVYRSSDERPQSLYVGGDGCSAVMDGEFVGGCSTFRMSWVERVSPEVATMVFVMGNGETVTLVGNDGYFVLEYAGQLPNNRKFGSRGSLLIDFDTFRSLTYLDANGTPIARRTKLDRVAILAPGNGSPFRGTDE